MSEYGKIIIQSCTKYLQNHNTLQCTVISPVKASIIRIQILAFIDGRIVTQYVYNLIFLYFQQFEEHSFENLYHSPISRQGGIGSLMTGFSAGNGQAFDPHMVRSIKDFLFRGPIVGGVRPNGFDLGAINIQRARDHGIPGE